MSLLRGRGKTVATRRRVPIWAFVVDWRLGLAILASAAAGRTQELVATGAAALPALNSGYRLAFGIGAACAAIAALACISLLRRQSSAQAGVATHRAQSVAGSL